MPEKFGIFPDKNDQTYIGKILYFLGKLDLIDTAYVPKFLLGSTRLAIIKKFGKEAITNNFLETNDIIDFLSKKKREYGDLDIDLCFKADKKEIVRIIESIDPSVYAAKAGSEIYVAIKLNDKVVQVDLVDVSKNYDAIVFLQKSSFLDLSLNIKGVFSIILLRAVISNMDFDYEDILKSILNNTNNIDSNSLLKQQINKGFIPSKIRFSLKNSGLKLVLELSKITLDKTKIEKIDIDLNTVVDYKNINFLAKQILQDKTASASDILHASRLAKFIKEKKPNKIENIWKDFIKIANERIKGINEEDFKIGIEQLSKIMGITKHKEGRQAINRFDGKNSFNNLKIFEILRILITSSNSEGKNFFKINLYENPVIDLIEKVDSIFCSFRN